MIFQEIPPCPTLQTLVRAYLLLHLDYGQAPIPAKPYPSRLEHSLNFFARGYVESHRPLSDTTSRIARNALFGQQVSRLNFQPVAEGDFLMLQVHFQPGALYRLLGIPSYELTDTCEDAELFLGSELRSVNEQIAHAKSYGEMIARVEAYLLVKSRQLQTASHPIDRIAQLLLTQPRTLSLDWLADQSNLSPRQFERKFSQRMGVGPKLFSRISRFFHTFSSKEAHPELDWLTVALHFGYTDYNHLAKDFRQFANVSPTVLMREYADFQQLAKVSPTVLMQEYVQHPEIIVNL